MALDLKWKYSLKKAHFSLIMKSLPDLELDQSLDRQLIKTKSNKKGNRSTYDILHKRIIKRRRELAGICRWINEYYLFCQENHFFPN